jgi:acyl-CoA synthetase (AMP-forming)/AMP-acid ligase II
VTDTVVDAPADQEQLQTLCRNKLAWYKAPEEWVFVSDMPRSAINKVIKRKLIEQYFNS